MKFLAIGAVGSLVWFFVGVMLLSFLLRVVIDVATIIVVMVGIGIPVYGVLRRQRHYRLGIRDILEGVKGLGLSETKVWLMLAVATLVVVSDRFALYGLVVGLVKGLAIMAVFFAVWLGARKMRPDLPSIGESCRNAW